MFVKERFYLNDSTEDYLRSLIAPFGYNGFGELVFYRTYSRVNCANCRQLVKWSSNGDPYCSYCDNYVSGQEDWADVVTRVTNGTFSIRKDWYLRNRITWDEQYWQNYATDFAISMYLMKWLPPGRGLWAMGSDFVYERGSMALQNCGFTLLGEDLGADISWLMDALMCGVGVGFSPTRDALTVNKPKDAFEFIIPDSREGWCKSVKLLIDAFLNPRSPVPVFNYSRIRPEGEPIRGFGGVASGPEPLENLHEMIIQFMYKYTHEINYDSVRLKTDIANIVGCCVVAGNVRRSAELACLSVTDKTFIDLKDYQKHPERTQFGWMSNNSVMLETDDDFQMLGEIAKRVIVRGEPGYLNMQNFPLARLGKKMKGLKRDKACGINPCGEQPLENKELCTLAETLPTMCKDHATWLKACEYATFYASTVTLLATHHSETNKVMQRNRRIGVGIIDYSGWKHEHGVHKIIGWMREGYKHIRAINRHLAEEAGIPESIRVTTCKPGGTTPKLPGKTSGLGHPTFNYTLRRIRISKNSAIHPLLVQANIPYEEDCVDKYTDIFEYPIYQGPAKPSDQVTVWEQVMNLITMQREWSDNAVSNTIYFKPKWKLARFIEYEEVQDVLVEYLGTITACQIITDDTIKEYEIPDHYKIILGRAEDGDVQWVKIYEFDPQHEEDQLENLLSAAAPLTKSLSMLPHSPKGAYKQMPEEGISKEEYEERLAAIKPIDWSQLSGSDGEDERFCTAEACEVRQ